MSSMFWINVLKSFIRGHMAGLPTILTRDIFSTSLDTLKAMESPHLFHDFSGFAIKIPLSRFILWILQFFNRAERFLAKVEGSIPIEVELDIADMRIHILQLEFRPYSLHADPMHDLENNGYQDPVDQAAENDPQ